MAVYEALLLNTVVPQIQAAQTGDSYVMVVNATTPALRITQTGTGNAISVEDEANPDATPFVVSAAGDVGIGTSSPLSKFHINVDGIAQRITRGSALGYLYWNGSTSSSDFTLQAANGNVQLFCELGSSGVIKFATEGAERARIDSSGNLGIGTAALTLATGLSLFKYGSQWTNHTTNTYPQPAGNTFLQMEAVAAQANWFGFTGSYGATSGSANLLLQVNLNNTSQQAGNYIASEAQSATSADLTFGKMIGGASTGANATKSEMMRLDASGNLVVGGTALLADANYFAVSPGNAWGVFGHATGIASGVDYVRFLYGGSSIGSIKQNSTNGIAVSSANQLVFEAGGSDRARITSGGVFLVGTDNATATAGAGVKVGISAGNVAAVTVDATGAADTYNYYSTNAAAFRFYVNSAGTVHATNTTISAISDQRLKENIQDLDVGLDKILALKPRKFDWKDGKGKNTKGDRGWIAQEFEQVFPDMIDEWKDPAPEGEEPYKSVRADLIPVMVKAIQELKAEVDSLKAQLEAK